ncbi:Hypothetical predicted protein [Olea europaea subsp. europaea]|uniref:Uncharacterized protein n=1 Tax=Olea europaea subsp. europaea TaxID=158383 RepID=A0A8S0T063_OLEEU|nr:Hypothetical predicted protein [Olea europaea subsp. europaea]
MVGIVDSFPDSIGSSFAHYLYLADEIPNFWSFDQLLESAERLSICTGPDESYKEMANLYDSLLMGRQQKMALINRHSRGSLSSISSWNSDEREKQTASHVLADAGF